MLPQRILFTLLTVLLSHLPAEASIVNFATWTAVGDPPNANMTASITPTEVTLRVLGGTIPSNTDISVQSVNADTPDLSTSGHFFSPASDFSVAIDYELTFGSNATGTLGLGFGIGEDGLGVDAAGPALLTINGVSNFPFAGAATVNDVPQFPPLNLGGPATLSGTLFVQYTAATGDITVGAATTQNAATPTFVGTFPSNLQNQWDDTNLLTSFFLRSDGGGWQSGTAEAVFRNFRVLDGTATAVPEPASATCLAFGAGGLWLARRRKTKTKTR